MLTVAERNHFDSQGYVVLRSVLDPDETLAPITTEHHAILDGLGESSAPGASVGERVIALARAGCDISQHFDISLPKMGITSDTPIHTGPAMFALMTDAHVLDAVEAIIGPEIYSSPTQHTRLKLPVDVRDALGDRGNSLSGPVPFHQDSGVLLEDADASEILTVWIPLSEATVENGCLRVLPGSHHRSELLDHCPSGPGGLGIPERLIDTSQVVALPMRPGDVLFMHRRTVHSSLNNLTAGEVRISLDLRYQPIGQPTGRPAFDDAGFVARSHARPDDVLRDPQVWARRWIALRDRLAAAAAQPRFDRWSSDALVCA